MAKNGELTVKQTLFVQEFMVDCNATQAAIRAGYSKKTANRIGSENLSKLPIQEAIKKRIAEVSEATGVTVERVINELAVIAFADILDYVEYDESGVRLIASEAQNFKRINGRAIKDLRTMKVKVGDDVETYTVINMHDKTKALDMLCKILGAYKPEMVQGNTVVVEGDLITAKIGVMEITEQKTLTDVFANLKRLGVVTPGGRN